MQRRPENDPLAVFEDFFTALQNQDIISLHSVHLVGTALTSDFDPEFSDINSIVVLPEMSLKFIEFLAPLGKKYKQRKIAAPLIMTPEYIASSLDSFPIEFLSYKLIHRTVYGPDILAGLSFKRKELQLQCEREVKSKLIWLRQGYINSFGDQALLVRRLAESIIGYFPLFRALLALNGKPVPKTYHNVIVRLQELIGIKTAIFEKIFLLRREKLRFDGKELVHGFEEYYQATEQILELVDDTAK